MEPLFLDIETRRTADLALIKRISSKVKPPGTHKKPETIQKWWAEEGESARTAAIEETALNGTYGRLASYAFAFGGIEPVCVTAKEHEGEALNIAAQNFQMADDVVAFNGDFDLRFLYQRMVINGVTVPKRLRRALNEKGGYVDPMRDWAGYRGYVSQGDLAAAMGIETTDTVTGADIGALIDAGNWDAVRAHNVADVVTLRQIYWRMYA